MFDKIIDLLKSPGYIEKKTIKIEISKQEILEWIRDGKIRVREDGYVEVINIPKNITKEAKLLESGSDEVTD